MQVSVCLLKVFLKVCGKGRQCHRGEGKQAIIVQIRDGRGRKCALVQTIFYFLTGIALICTQGRRTVPERRIVLNLSAKTEDSLFDVENDVGSFICAS